MLTEEAKQQLELIKSNIEAMRDALDAKEFSAMFFMKLAKSNPKFRDVHAVYIQANIIINATIENPDNISISKIKEAKVINDFVQACATEEIFEDARLIFEAFKLAAEVVNIYQDVVVEQVDEKPIAIEAVPEVKSQAVKAEFKAIPSKGRIELNTCLSRGLTRLEVGDDDNDNDGVQRISTNGSNFNMTKFMAQSMQERRGKLFDSNDDLSDDSYVDPEEDSDDGLFRVQSLEDKEAQQLDAAVKIADAISAIGLLKNKSTLYNLEAETKQQLLEAENLAARAKQLYLAAEAAASREAKMLEISKIKEQILSETKKAGANNVRKAERQSLRDNIKNLEIGLKEMQKSVYADDAEAYEAAKQAEVQADQIMRDMIRNKQTLMIKTEKKTIGHLSKDDIALNPVAKLFAKRVLIQSAIKLDPKKLLPNAIDTSAIQAMLKKRQEPEVKVESPAAVKLSDDGEYLKQDATEEHQDAIGGNQDAIEENQGATEENQDSTEEHQDEIASEVDGADGTTENSEASEHDQINEILLQDDPEENQDEAENISSEEDGVGFVSLGIDKNVYTLDTISEGDEDELETDELETDELETDELKIDELKIDELETDELDTPELETKAPEDTFVETPLYKAMVSVHHVFKEIYTTESTFVENMRLFYAELDEVANSNSQITDPAELEAINALKSSITKYLEVMQSWFDTVSHYRELIINAKKGPVVASGDLDRVKQQFILQASQFFTQGEHQSAMLGLYAKCIQYRDLGLDKGDKIYPLKAGSPANSKWILPIQRAARYEALMKSILSEVSKHGWGDTISDQLPNHYLAIETLYKHTQEFAADCNIIEFGAKDLNANPLVFVQARESTDARMTSLPYIYNIAKKLRASTKLSSGYNLDAEQKDLILLVENFMANFESDAPDPMDISIKLTAFDKARSGMKKVLREICDADVTAQDINEVVDTIASVSRMHRFYQPQFEHHAATPVVVETGNKYLAEIMNDYIVNIRYPYAYSQTDKILNQIDAARKKYGLLLNSSALKTLGDPILIIENHLNKLREKGKISFEVAEEVAKFLRDNKIQATERVYELLSDPAVPAVPVGLSWYELPFVAEHYKLLRSIKGLGFVTVVTDAEIAEQQRNNLNSMLNYSVIHKNLTEVKYCLDQGADVNYACKNIEYKGATALWHAVTSHNLEMANELIKNGAGNATVTSGKDAGTSILWFLAANSFQIPEMQDMFWQLINTASQEDVNAIVVNSAEGYAGTSALSWAVANRLWDMAEALVIKGAKLDAKSCETSQNRTILECLRAMNTPESARLLIAAGIKIPETNVPVDEEDSILAPVAPDPAIQQLAALVDETTAKQTDFVNNIYFPVKGLGGDNDVAAEALKAKFVKMLEDAADDDTALGAAARFAALQNALAADVNLGGTLGNKNVDDAMIALRALAPVAPDPDAQLAALIAATEEKQTAFLRNTHPVLSVAGGPEEANANALRDRFETLLTTARNDRAVPAAADRLLALQTALGDAVLNGRNVNDELGRLNALAPDAQLVALIAATEAKQADFVDNIFPALLDGAANQAAANALKAKFVAILAAADDTALDAAARFAALQNALAANDVALGGTLGNKNVDDAIGALRALGVALYNIKFANEAAILAQAKLLAAADTTLGFKVGINAAANYADLAALLPDAFATSTVPALVSLREAITANNNFAANKAEAQLATEGLTQAVTNHEPEEVIPGRLSPDFLAKLNRVQANKFAALKDPVIMEQILSGKIAGAGAVTTTHPSLATRVTDKSWLDFKMSMIHYVNAQTTKRLTVKIQADSDKFVLIDTKYTNAEITTVKTGDKLSTTLPDVWFTAQNKKDKQRDVIILEIMRSLIDSSVPGSKIVIGNCADQPETAIILSKIALSKKINVKFDEATRLAVLAYTNKPQPGGWFSGLGRRQS